MVTQAYVCIGRFRDDIHAAPVFVVRAVKKRQRIINSNCTAHAHQGQRQSHRQREQLSPPLSVSAFGQGKSSISFGPAGGNGYFHKK
jgi:hypothetical protein